MTLMVDSEPCAMVTGGGGSVLPSVGTTTASGCLGTGTATLASAGSAQVTTAPAEGLPSQPRRPGENRRSNKPIMEKRRRARINNCLNELKTLILDAMKKDPARHSKLEKADILEMTVKHLETLQRQQVAMTAASDPTVVNKFRAGFSECAGEVGRFPGLDTPVRRRLLQHLANCLNGSPAPTSTTPGDTPTQSVQVHILPTPETNPQPQQPQQHQQGIFFSTNSGGGLQLVPTRLPNGDIALVLPSGTTQFRTNSPSPSSSSNSSSPLPMLIPIPQRTSSSASASSVSSCTSPVAFERLTVCSPVTRRSPTASCDAPLSPEYHEYERAYSPPMQKPLALVMRKRTEEINVDDEAPWRPW